MENRNFNDALGLGAWLGRKQAFGLLAGKCSAADAECLRKMRDERKYRSLGMNWDDFCRTHIGISRGTVDKIIKLLEEFGPQYFELSAVVRITPEEYRRIAPAITRDGVAHRGRLLEIAMDNAAELSAAVQELQREAAPPRDPDPASAAFDRSLERARKAMQGALETYTRFGAERLDTAARMRLANHLRELSSAILRISCEQFEAARAPQ